VEYGVIIIPEHFNPLKTEDILRKFQKVIYFNQKWKDSKNNGTT
jgi:hypothetical protein